MSKGKAVTRNDLERIRFELSEELNGMSRRQRKEYLKAAREVYGGLAKMAKIRAAKD